MDPPTPKPIVKVVQPVVQVKVRVNCLLAVPSTRPPCLFRAAAAHAPMLHALLVIFKEIVLNITGAASGSERGAVCQPCAGAAAAAETGVHEQVHWHALLTYIVIRHGVCVALRCTEELQLGWHARPATMHLDCCTHHDMWPVDGCATEALEHAGSSRS